MTDNLKKGTVDIEKQKAIVIGTSSDVVQTPSVNKTVATRVNQMEYKLNYVSKDNSIQNYLVGEGKSLLGIRNDSKFKITRKNFRVYEEGGMYSQKFRVSLPGELGGQCSVVIPSSSFRYIRDLYLSFDISVSGNQIFTPDFTGFTFLDKFQFRLSPSSSVVEMTDIHNFIGVIEKTESFDKLDELNWVTSFSRVKGTSFTVIIPLNLPFNSFNPNLRSLPLPNFMSGSGIELIFYFKHVNNLCYDPITGDKYSSFISSISGANFALNFESGEPKYEVIENYMIYPCTTPYCYKTLLNINEDTWNVVVKGLKRGQTNSFDFIIRDPNNGVDYFNSIPITSCKIKANGTTLIELNTDVELRYFDMKYKLKSSKFFTEIGALSNSPGDAWDVPAQTSPDGITKARAFFKLHLDPLYKYVRMIFGYDFIQYIPNPPTYTDANLLKDFFLTYPTGTPPFNNLTGWLGLIDAVNYIYGYQPTFLNMGSFGYRMRTSDIGKVFI